MNDDLCSTVYEAEKGTFSFVFLDGLIERKLSLQYWCQNKLVIEVASYYDTCSATTKKGITVMCIASLRILVYQTHGCDMLLCLHTIQTVTIIIYIPYHYGEAGNSTEYS